MPPRRIPLILLALALLLVPASTAQARYLVGISDQSPVMFSQPAFQALGLKRVHYIVSWDFQRNGFEVAEADGFIRTAALSGKEVFVTFNSSRGCYTNNRYSRASRCRAPSATAYRRAFQGFRARYPFVKVFAPWNEANHKSQPTAKSPKLAARYYNVLRSACRGCKLVAADVLDQAGVERYLRSFIRYANGSPRRWGLHNYSDVNRRRSTGTRGVLRTVPGEVWLTETGGVVKFGTSFPYSLSRAASRTRYMFSLADTYTRRRRGLRSAITRLYPYQWTGAPRGARFDAGMTNPDGSLRPAYSVFRSLAARRAK